jgi:hypothetical protein
VAVTVLQVGVMGMCMGQRGMCVLMTMPNPGWESRMDVFVMTVVVPVPVPMRHGFMTVLVLVPSAVQQP